MTTTTSLAPLLERFFTQRLMQQREASPHTIRSYRDSFRQLLTFAQRRLHRPPSRLNIEQIDAPLVAAFLEELEKQRSLTVRRGAIPISGSPRLEPIDSACCSQWGRLHGRLLIPLRVALASPNARCT